MKPSHSDSRTDAPVAASSHGARVLTAFFVLIVSVLTALAVVNPALFNALMYEDAWGEWATFFAFALGGVVGIVGFVCTMRSKVVSPSQTHRGVFLCGLLGVSLFCLLAAGEEISWGQRLFGLMPPEMFQELNDQQELNFHNILISFISARLVVGLICFGYGVALPLTVRFKRPDSDESSERFPPLPALRAVAPSLYLSPWFALVGVVYSIQPVPMALEAMELMLGLLLLADVFLKCQWTASKLGQTLRQSVLLPVVLTLPLLLGAVTNPLLDRFVFGADEKRVAQARKELAMIAWDLQHSGAIYPQIAIANRLYDNRIYSSVRDDMVRFKDNSRFYGARLFPKLDATQKQRRTYFLDPWNNPYWICMKGYGQVHLYSFGPNRRSETLLLYEQRVPTEADMQGDDIGVWVDLYESQRKSLEAASGDPSK